ncbi:MAG: hypothetical protein ONB17_05405 [candidate division KSB1 bacterium]|nr:hypothetical protein [candidate division KSB1 bacterium]MDZ7295811.1 hypothetical protein [candidate division KSB1 bacterium]MDZ7378402.1 hypothetical protein [candidate division KSB1 bacterium]MDZ7385146.1 hypothetical protein [candidate division KSB1 bacterium]MDZ7391574.1 hypothetical protein [candidate division KSB1 bacterium]
MRLWLVLGLVGVVSVSPLLAQAALTAAGDTLAKPPVRVTVLKRDPLLGEDKVHHALVSAFLAVAAYYGAHDESRWSRGHALVFATSFSLSWGVGKEIYDKRSGRGHASVADLVADVAGTALGLALFAGQF